MKNIEFRYLDAIDVDIKLRQKITVLGGNSATGKTYIFNIIKAYSTEEEINNILCLNINDFGAGNMLQRIKEVSNGIILIDQADDTLKDEEINKAILTDDNYYILMGRNLLVNKRYSEKAAPKIENKKLSIRYMLPNII